MPLYLQHNRGESITVLQYCFAWASNNIWNQMLMMITFITVSNTKQKRLHPEVFWQLKIHQNKFEFAARARKAYDAPQI